MRLALLNASCFSMLILSSLLIQPSINADEPAEEFLEKLREHGYYNVALDWLDSMESSPLASEAFRKKVTLEKSKTIIEQLPKLRNPNLVDQRLDEADELLKKYSSTETNPDLLSEADVTRASLFLGRANRLNLLSKSDRINAARRTEYQDSAKEYLKQADELFNSAKARFRSRIENFVVDPADKNSKAEKRRLEREHLKMRFQAPVIKEMLADTYGPNAPEYKKYLEEAASEFADLYKRFKQFGGSSRCMDAARCYKKLGNHDEALSYLADVFAFRNDPAILNFKKRAALLAIECWAHKDPYPYPQVILYFKPMVEHAGVMASRDPDWHYVRLELAKAYRAKAVALDNAETKDAASRKQARELNVDALKLARKVARASGDVKKTAAELLKEWNINIPVEEVVTSPKTLADARSRGRELLTNAKDYRLSINDDLSALLKKLSAATTEEEKVGIKNQMKPLTDSLEEQVNEALEMFKLAESLATPETTTDDLNLIRYYQCESYFTMLYYYESAIIGRYMLERYPENNGSSNAAAIVARCYWNLYIAAPADNRQWESNELKATTEIILKHWRGSAIANEACTYAMTVSRVEKNREAVEQYAGQMAEDSVERGKGEIWLGQQFRDDSIREKRKLQASKTPITDAHKSAWAANDQKALQWLTTGIKRLTADDVNSSVIRGAIARIELLLNANQVDAAMAQLEGDLIAPIDLAKDQHEALEGQPALRRDIYRVATRTYLAAMQNGKSSETLTAKVEGALNALRQVMSTEPDGTRKLVTIYVQLASQMKTQFDQIKEPAKRIEYAKHLQPFFDKIQADSKNVQTLIWAASTLGKVAERLDEDDATNDAAKLYRQANDILNASDAIAKNDAQTPENLKSEIERQKALMLRGIGEYQGAINLFAEILEKKATNVRVQMDAAETYQMWGSSSDDSKHYVRAIMGGEQRVDPKTKRKRNVIWGWRTLCSATNHKEGFEDIFYHSLLNMAECRYHYGRIKDSKKAIRNGLIEIKNQFDRAPDMGGPKWRPKFDQLTRDIQKAIGDPTKGLAGLND